MYLLASRPTSGAFSLNYAVYTRVGTENYSVKGKGSWTTAGKLATPLTALQRNVVLTASTLPDGGGIGTIGRLNDEIVRIEHYNAITGAIVLGRGCLDTIPQSHALGSILWFGEPVGPDPTRYVQGDVVKGKALTNTNGRQLAPNQAIELTRTAVCRYIRPYPPAYVRIDNTDIDTISTAAIGLTVSWLHRNRVTQSDVILTHTNPSVTPESGTTYTIEVRRRSDNVLIRTVSGITTQSWVYDSGAWATDGSPSSVYIDLYSVRGGWTSWQRYHIPLTIVSASSTSVWGINWGGTWGG